MIKDIAFTVYAVTDITRSRAFYEGVLGLKTNSEYNGSGNSPWVEYEVGTATFAIGCSPEWKPSIDGASVAFDVDDFDSYVAKLKAKNVTFTLDAQSFPGCSMAVISDPDNNKVIIHKKKILS